jgi:hypothetical protein
VVHGVCCDASVPVVYIYIYIYIYRRGARSQRRLNDAADDVLNEKFVYCDP